MFSFIVLLAVIPSGRSFHRVLMPDNALGKRRHCSWHFSQVDDNVQPLSTFVSPEMKVYIEDTDAYGIMYNANYLRAADRALHMDALDSAEKEGSPRRTFRHEDDWLIVSVSRQKFKSAPELGVSYHVEASLIHESESTETYDIVIGGESQVFNTIEGLVITKDHIPEVDSPALDDGGKVFVDQFVAYRDEFVNKRFPLRSVLNLFERSRSNWLGGPSGLRKLQQEGVLFVVTEIRDLSLVQAGREVSPGDTLEICTSFSAKRKGMIIECLQCAYLENELVAKGEVVLFAIDEATRRPTTKLPLWLKEKL